MTLICHEHRFVYLKARKVASTSIEKALSLECTGADDVVTKDTSSAGKEAPEPKNHGKLTGSDVEGASGASHQYWQEIIKVYPNVQGYQKICGIRNPIEQVNSLYYYSNNNRKMGFDQFISFADGKGWLDNERYYFPNGHPCEHVIRFENLESDYQKVCESFGLTVQDLPHIRERPHAPAVVSDNARKMIDKIYERTFKQWYPPV